MGTRTNVSPKLKNGLIVGGNLHLKKNLSIPQFLAPSFTYIYKKKMQNALVEGIFWKLFKFQTKSENNWLYMTNFNEFDSHLRIHKSLFCSSVCESVLAKNLQCIWRPIMIIRQYSFGTLMILSLSSACSFPELNTGMRRSSAPQNASIIYGVSQKNATVFTVLNIHF